MSKKDPSMIVEKYGRGVAGAGADYAAGVSNPSRSWSQATQQGAARWAAGVQDAITNKKFERGVAASGDAKWQARAANIGAQRYQAAAQDAAAAYQQVAAKIMSAASAAQSAVAALPNATLEQRIARSAAAQRAISAAWSTGKK